MANDKVEPFVEPEASSPEGLVEATETLSVATKLKKKRRIRTGWTRKVAMSAEEVEAARRYTVRVPCEGGLSAGAKQITKEVQVTVSAKGEGQHTVTWAETITLPYRVDDVPALLKPGHCNLYRYPKVYFDHIRKGKSVVPAPEALLVLEKVLLALLLDTVGNSDGMFSERFDSAGARPQHGLILANTPASLDLLLQAVRKRPQLIALAHVGQPFEGENSLHVLAVNQQQEVLCEVVELAAANLNAQQCKETFLSAATGVFFSAEPMCYYGSYPFSCAPAATPTAQPASHPPPSPSTLSPAPALHTFSPAHHPRPLATRSLSPAPDAGTPLPSLCTTCLRRCCAAQRSIRRCEA